MLLEKLAASTYLPTRHYGLQGTFHFLIVVLYRNLVPTHGGLTLSLPAGDKISRLVVLSWSFLDFVVLWRIFVCGTYSAHPVRKSNEAKYGTGTLQPHFWNLCRQHQVGKIFDPISCMRFYFLVTNRRKGMM